MFSSEGAGPSSPPASPPDSPPSSEYGCQYTGSERSRDPASSPCTTPSTSPNKSFRNAVFSPIQAETPGSPPPSPPPTPPPVPSSELAFLRSKVKCTVGGPQGEGRSLHRKSKSGLREEHFRSHPHLPPPGIPLLGRVYSCPPASILCSNAPCKSIDASSERSTKTWTFVLVSEKDLFEKDFDDNLSDDERDDFAFYSSDWDILPDRRATEPPTSHAGVKIWSGLPGELFDRDLIAVVPETSPRNCFRETVDALHSERPSLNGITIENEVDKNNEMPPSEWQNATISRPTANTASTDPTDMGEPMPFPRPNPYELLTGDVFVKILEARRKATEMEAEGNMDLHGKYVFPTLQLRSAPTCEKLHYLLSNHKRDENDSILARAMAIPNLFASQILKRTITACPSRLLPVDRGLKCACISCDEHRPTFGCPECGLNLCSDCFTTGMDTARLQGHALEMHKVPECKLMTGHCSPEVASELGIGPAYCFIPGVEIQSGYDDSDHHTDEEFHESNELRAKFKECVGKDDELLPALLHRLDKLTFKNLKMVDDMGLDPAMRCRSERPRWAWRAEAPWGARLVEVLGWRIGVLSGRSTEGLGKEYTDQKIDGENRIVPVAAAVKGALLESVLERLHGMKSH